MRLSHRDHRVDRELRRSAAAMLGLVGTLGVIAIAAPLDALRFGAVADLAIAGGSHITQTRRVVDEYVGDLESFAAEVPGADRLGAEIRSQVGLERVAAGPSRRSPHSRRRATADLSLEHDA
jgi:hypothetical protein